MLTVLLRAIGMLLRQFYSRMIVMQLRVEDIIPLKDIEERELYICQAEKARL